MAIRVRAVFSASGFGIVILHLGLDRAQRRADSLLGQPGASGDLGKAQPGLAQGQPAQQLLVALPLPGAAAGPGA